MKFLKPLAALLALAGALVAPGPVTVHAADAPTQPAAEPDPMGRLLANHKQVVGPAAADMNNATFNVPKDYLFTDGNGARTLLEAMGNIANGSEQGLLMSPDREWFVVFEFNDDGYVKDDDKDQLDADKMLKAIKEGNEAANEERERRGIPALHVLGWEQPPRYNETTHNLEWATRAESEGGVSVNYNTRLLGRRGVMEVTLVCDPTILAATLPQYQEVLGSFNYRTGETYAEYRQGDKVAQYGLAALVLGGAAAGAAKLGLFAWVIAFAKKGWKLIAIVVAAVATGIAKLFGRRRTHSE
jgi:uncharacterized membrane-anchored protein